VRETFAPRVCCSSHASILPGMRERAELVGGTLQVDSQPGRGTTVVIRIPVAQRPRETVEHA